MREYETIYIINSTLGDEQIQEVVERFKSIIEKNGELLNFDEWGNRKLAYPINHLKEGYYVLANFKAEPEFIKELDRLYRINDNVIRHIIIRQDD